MDEKNKVLTVSYGTFSCRLEGFEDSVETMKTVVAYFHELAGHDRFMDMEPQAPDMQTLARLTEEDVDGTVEVEGEGQRVSLRVQQPEADEQTQEDRPSLRIEHPQSDEQPEERPSLRLHRPEPIEDGAAALAAALRGTDAGPTDDDEDDVVSELDEDDLEDSTEEFNADVAATDEDSDDMDADDTEEDSIIADIADADEDTPFYDPSAEEEVAEESDSVAAKLQRIRAVVSRIAPPAPAAEEDDSDVTDAGEDKPMLLQEEDRSAVPHTRLVDGFEFDSEDGDSTETPLVLSDDDAEEDVAEVQEEDDDPLFADDDVSDLDDVEEGEPALAEEDAATTDLEEAEGDEEVAAQLEETVDIVEEGEAIDDDSAEQLSEEVAEVEREIAMRRQNRSKRDYLPENDDDAMKRIMSQTDERLNEPEGRRHRDAFAQLKAAVAATEAARQLGDRVDSDDPEDAFREDLDEVVRPDDADSDEETKRKNRSVSTPLKLVASQRVEGEEDEDTSEPAARLRQIAAVKTSGENASGGFAEFAAEKGATELADLLEAAAAYIAFVEGDDDFSRPQVMKKVQMASSDEFSREDGLRSFGRLLRQSKIIKLNNGRFQVAQDTRFRPDDKAAQG